MTETLLTLLLSCSILSCNAGPVKPKTSSDIQHQTAKNADHRKAMASWVATLSLQTMPYDKLMQLQHALILIHPIFQNGRATGAHFAQDSAVRSNVTTVDVLNAIHYVLDDVVTGQQKTRVNTILQTAGFLDEEGDPKPITYSSRVATTPPTEAKRWAGKFNAMMADLEELKVSAPWQPNKKISALELCQQRMKFLKSACSQTLTKRYDPVRSSQKQLKIPADEVAQIFKEDTAKEIALKRLHNRELRERTMAKIRAGDKSQKLQSIMEDINKQSACLANPENRGSKYKNTKKQGNNTGTTKKNRITTLR